MNMAPVDDRQRVQRCGDLTIRRVRIGEVEGGRFDTFSGHKPATGEGVVADMANDFRVDPAFESMFGFDQLMSV